MAAFTRTILPNATQYSETCCISQSSTVTHYFSTDDFLDWFELLNAQCGKGIKTYQAWICLNKKHTEGTGWKKKIREERAQTNRKMVKMMYVCESLCVLGTRTRRRLYRGLCFLLHNHMRTVFWILMQAKALYLILFRTVEDGGKKKTYLHTYLFLCALICLSAKIKGISWK